MAELQHARELLKGTAVPWVEGRTTWPGLPPFSNTAWEATLRMLTEANREMVQAVDIYRSAPRALPRTGAWSAPVPGDGSAGRPIGAWRFFRRGCASSPHGTRRSKASP
jgi:hypothetical protein